MIKTYIMFNKDDKYTITNENQEELLDIQKKNLSLDGKKLYDALFSNFEKGDNIKLDKDKSLDESSDKLPIEVYKNIKDIIEKIVVGINETDIVK